MGLKKRNKPDAGFSMSSMTDIIFLLLLFFMIASTMSSPNDMKVNLPESKNTKATKAHIVKVAIAPDETYWVADGGEAPKQLSFEEIEPYVVELHSQDTTLYIALHADETVPYKEVVKVFDIANSNRIKMVIATKVLEK